MQVRNTTDPNAKPGLGETMRHLFSIFVPVDAFAMAARGIGVFMLVLGTVFGGGLVSAQIYRDSTPGEMMYRLKLAVEKAQLMLAPNDDYRTRLHTEFADRRIDEVAKLAEGSTFEQSLLPGVLVAFETEILALQDGLEKLRSEDPDGVIDVAKLLERKMAVYQNMLRKADASLATSQHAAIAATRNQVDSVAIKAMAVIVEKHLAGSDSAPKTVVVNKFEERLRLAENKLSAAPEKNTPRAARQTKAKAAIAEAKLLIAEEKYQAALTKIEEVAVLTQEEEEEQAKEEDKIEEAAPAVTETSHETTPPAQTSTTEGAPETETNTVDPPK